MSVLQRVRGSRRFFYGWLIVGVSLISMAFWFGLRTSFSVFYASLLEEFPWNRGEAAGVQSMALVTYTFVAPLVGGLIDRCGPRKVILPGIFLLSAGLILCSTIDSLSSLYIYYGVIVGAGLATIGLVPYSAILAHWFEKRLGLASGIAGSGMGVGTFVLVPVTQYLIDLRGWRFTFDLIGVLAFMVLLPLNGLFLRHRPSDVGLSPDGSPAAETGGSRPSQAGNHDWPMRKVIRTPRYWALLLFPFFCVLGVYIILVHNVRFLIDQGVNRMTAAYIFAGMGVVSSVFRVIWGWISDRIGRETTYSCGMAVICAGVLSLLLLDYTGERLFIYLFLAFFGMGWAVTAVMFVSTAADLFRGKTFGLIYGTVEGVLGIGGAFGSWVAGAIFDRTRSYRPAFMLAIFVFVLSCVFMWLAAPRKSRERRAWSTEQPASPSATPCQGGKTG
jgi:MFS family permease